MKIYCSGIGGIGLSAYAALQRNAGHHVCGSDRTESALIDDLRSQGIDVKIDQSGKNVPTDADLFVYTEALPPNAPERVRAAELGIRQLSYPQALGELSRNKRVIAVCGTHGKSSTTGMAAKLLLEAGFDPTVVVGTKLRELNDRNWKAGSGDIFLLEACEYKHAFLSYAPSIILLTNCDGDHFDFYESVESYRSAFEDFVLTLPNDGILITHMGDPDCASIATSSGKTIIDADQESELRLQTPGAHMRENAKLVLALGKILNIPHMDAAKYVSQYAGSWRRMEKRGTTKEGIDVIDDYGHHPKEISATLSAMREAYPDARIVCVFQPHTHDRTQKLYADFCGAFTDADIVIIPDIYDARAHADGSLVSVPTFTKDVAKGSGVEAVDGKSLEQTEALLHAILRPGDLLITMGAGNITDLAGKMLR